jgi:hypothetical protein
MESHARLQLKRDMIRRSYIESIFVSLNVSFAYVYLL